MSAPLTHVRTAALAPTLWVATCAPAAPATPDPTVKQTSMTAHQVGHI